MADCNVAIYFLIAYLMVGQNRNLFDIYLKDNVLFKFYFMTPVIYTNTNLI